MYNIAVFASGSGSNAENMVTHYRTSDFARVRVIFTNKKDALVLQRAERLGIDSETFSYADFKDPAVFLPLIGKYGIDFIVLAGFLLKVPDYLVDRYKNRIINIHPSLLPKFGGKGMFGHYVHEAVISSGEKESGITIHSIDNNYDEGVVIHQSKVEILPDDTAESLEEKIHILEKKYPEISEIYFKSLVR